MKQYVLMSNEELYGLQHFGVPGMKWGVRKSVPSLGRAVRSYRQKNFTKKGRIRRDEYRLKMRKKAMKPKTQKQLDRERRMTRRNRRKYLAQFLAANVAAATGYKAYKTYNTYRKVRKALG